MRMLMMTVMMIMMMDAFRHIWDWVGEGGGHPEQSPEEPLVYSTFAMSDHLT